MRQIIIACLALFSISAFAQSYSYKDHNVGLVISGGNVDRVDYAEYGKAIADACLNRKELVKKTIVVVNRHKAQGMTLSPKEFTDGQDAKEICETLTKEELTQMQAGTDDLPMAIIINTMAGLPDPYGLSNPLN